MSTGNSDRLAKACKRFMERNSVKKVIGRWLHCLQNSISEWLSYMKYIELDQRCNSKDAGSTLSWN